MAGLKPRFNVYADGSYLPGKKRAGVGIVLVDADNGRMFWKTAVPLTHLRPRDSAQVEAMAATLALELTAVCGGDIETYHGDNMSIIHIMSRAPLLKRPRRNFFLEASRTLQGVMDAGRVSIGKVRHASDTVNPFVRMAHDEAGDASLVRREDSLRLFDATFAAAASLRGIRFPGVAGAAPLSVYSAPQP